MAQEVAGDLAQVVLLFAVDGGFGGLDGARGTGFHLDEAENVFVPADQIEFAAMIGRSVVAGDDNVAEAAEVEVGFFFAAAAGSEVLGGCVGGRIFSVSQSSARSVVCVRRPASIP